MRCRAELSDKHLAPAVVRISRPAPRSTLMRLKSYKGLDSEYLHQVIDHAVEYVRGRVHTNGLENFWSLLKRAIQGTYVAVDPAHLDRYLDEQTFRFNKRKGNDATRFLEVMLSVVGKRLTYRELTAPVSQVRFNGEKI